MKKDYYTQDAKRAAFLKNFAVNMAKARCCLQVFTSICVEAIASARAWLGAYSPHKYYAINKDRGQPTGGQSATISVVVGYVPVVVLAR